MALGTRSTLRGAGWYRSACAWKMQNGTHKIPLFIAFRR